MDTFKKVLKIVGIIAAIAGLAAGIYFVVSKVLAKRKGADDEENYVTCSCLDDEPVEAAE